MRISGSPGLPPKITPTRVFINKKEEGKKRIYYLTAGDAKMWSIAG